MAERAKKITGKFGGDMSDFILQAEGVCKSFGGVIANNAVSLSAPRGEIVGLIGPNGSGKSTFFNLIAGTHPADGGSIRFEGREITKLSAPQIAQLGLIRTYQQTRVYREMSCMDNMRISAPPSSEFSEGDLRAIFASPPSHLDDEAKELLEFVGLLEKRELLAGELSFGQQKLLELAMALMRRPKMLLLDEPTAGINPTLINGIVARLRTVNERLGITLLVIEHNMRVIMNLARHVVCLAHGEVLAAGPAADIQSNPRVLDAYLGAQ